MDLASSGVHYKGPMLLERLLERGWVMVDGWKMTRKNPNAGWQILFSE